MAKLQIFSAFFILNFFSCVHTERTRDKMYNSIIGASCFRRLNGTHQTGCSSSFSGSVGVLHVIKSQDDINFILNNPPSPPYAAVIPPHLFTRENIIRLKNDAYGNVSAIILINKIENMKNFSHELPCPNQLSNIKKSNNYDIEECNPNKPDTLWNPYGTGLLHEDYPFPIYYVADTDEIQKILDCFEKFNNYDYENHNKRSLCSIQVNSFMSAAVNSEVCIRRTNFVNNLKPIKFCDPLEGKNIYATLYPRKNIIQQKNLQRHIDKSEKFILITCRLDTTSMFDGVGLGAMDSLISYTTLMNVAHVLSKILPDTPDIANDDDKINVLYVIFNGESYDYIGSQRFVYDLKHLSFPFKSTQTNPITFDNIKFIIDLGILDDLNNIKLFYLQDQQSLINEFLVRLRNSNKLLNLNVTFEHDLKKRLPPTSAQSFLRENSTLPCVILSSEPKNQYYHSIYDDSVNIKFYYRNISNKIDFSKLQNRSDEAYNFNSDSIQMKIRDLSTIIAYSIYGMIKDEEYNGALIANPVLVDELLYCFLQSADCPLFRAASHPNSLPGLPVPPMRYISVHGASQEAAGWTYRVLGYLTSQIYPNIKKENCTTLPLHWFAGYNNTGECRLTTQNFSHALSPAFLDPDYDWKSGKYSTWTESTWSQFSARIFLKPSVIHEAWTLSIGFVVMIFSFVIVYLINSRSDVLFENCIITATISEPAAC